MRCPSLAELPPPSPDKKGWPWTTESAQLSDMMPNGRPWPKISIVTPNYNHSEFIEEAIRSVLLQGYPDLEYIVIDGGSTDESIEIIAKYKPWISHIEIGPDNGQAEALKKGFSLARGEILAWLNSDDRYQPNTLRRVAEFFVSHPKVVFGNGDVNFIDSKGKLIKKIYAVKPNYLLTANLGVHGWPQQGCFWRRKAYEAAGGIDSSLQFCMDRDLFIRLIKIGPSRRIPGPPLADFRLHNKTKSATLLKTASRESLILINRYGSRKLRSHESLLRILWQIWNIPTIIRAHIEDLRRK